MSYANQVRQFTEACREDLPESPVKQIPPDRIAWIKQMVKDEMEEFHENSSTLEVADALIDAMYYMCDFAATQGINLDPLFQIVHAANMQKVDSETGKVIREKKGPRKGKILKPKGWQDPEPYLREELERQELRGSWPDLFSDLGYIYLAGPYSHDEEDKMEGRFLWHMNTASALATKGYLVYSPICHWHPVAQKNNLPRDFSYWKKLNYCFVDKCARLVVMTLAGWDHSKGTQSEIVRAKQKGIPVSYVAPGSNKLTHQP